MNGKVWLFALAMIGLFVASSSSAWAVTQADVVRLKQKVARGEMLTVTERQLAADAQRELGSLIRPPVSAEAPRRPAGTLDEYEWEVIDHEWVDISETGISSGIQDDDDMRGPFDLGFSVSFFDQTYTSVYMCSNGWATFTENWAAYSNQTLPDFEEPHCAAYAFWDDLYPPSGGQYLYYPDEVNDRFILSWLDVPHISDDTELYSFQIIIYANGNIQYNYLSISDGAIGNSSCSSGLENETSELGLEICYDGSGTPPVSESSILIVQPDGIPNPVSNLVAQVLGHDVTLTWVDPTHDTNGNLITLTNLQVFQGPPSDENLVATVLPGVQTATITGVADGVRYFYVRGFATPYYGSARMVEILVGTPSYNNDFNTTDGQWVADLGWEWGEVTSAMGPEPYSGPYVWGTGLQAGYPDFADYNLTLDLGLAIGNEDAYMEFWYWYDLEFFWDGCNVKVSLDGGETWEIVDPEEGYTCEMLNESDNVMTGERCWSGTSEGWRHTVIPLGAYNGEAPIFRLQMGSDQIVSDMAGFFLDNMLIWGLAEPVFATISGNITLDGGSGSLQNVVVRTNGYGAPFANPLADGSYTINNVIVGDRRVRASLAGYETSFADAEVTETGAAGINLTLVRSDPPAPTGIAGEVNSASGLVEISWTTSPDPLVDQYRVFRRLAEDDNFEQVGVVAASPFTETLTADGIYQYRVTAVDVNVSTPVESDPSQVVTVLFGELPVPQLGANGDFDDRIRLSWLAPGTLEGTEIGYDDGSAEFFFVVNWPSGPSDYFAVRMSPPDDAIYPMLIYSADIFVQNDTPLPWVAICPPAEDGNGPDIDNPLQEWEDLEADGAPGWVTAETEGLLFLEEAQDFYIVMRVPEGLTDNQPACGADDSAPDGRSYYTWEPPFWQNVEWVDGIMRAWVGGAPPAAGSLNGSTPEYYMLSNGTVDGYAIERVPAIPVNRQMAQSIPLEQAMSSKVTSTKSAKVGPVRQTVNPAGALDRWFRPYVEAPELQLVTREPRRSLDDILNYRVYRNNVMVGEPTATNYFDAGRVENTNYTYHVTAYYDNLVESPQSPSVTMMCNMAPASPTGLNGTPIGNTQMRLNWVAPTTNDDGTPLVDLANYKVYRGANLIGTVPAGTTQYVDTPPQNDGYYVWTVTAEDEVPNVSDPAEPFLGAVVSPWEPVDYEWVDISDIGTEIQLEWWGAISGPHDLGFNFPFLDGAYSQVWISGMGFVTFVELFSGFFDNENIPNGFEPHAAIYPFWDALFSDALNGGGHIYVYQDNAEDRFIISWEQSPHLFDFNFVYTFQLILGEDGSIIMNYNTIPQEGFPGNSDCTIGVEDETSSAGIQIYSFGSGDFAPVSESAVAFWAGPSGSVTGIVREFGSNAPLADALITVAQNPEFFTTSDPTGVYLLEVDPGTYTVRIHKQGYCDQEIQNVVVVDDGTVTHNFSMHQPTATFNVTSLNILAVTGQNAASQFEITNPGATCDLEYAITTNQTWLTVNTPSGEVVPNGSQIINVSGTTANFAPGDYSATITVTHNDHNSPLTIPVTISVTTDGSDSPELPTEFALRANYPNPFNATTVLNFDVPQESHVELVVFNVQGQEVARPVDRLLSAGRHAVNYSAEGLPSGMYIVKMTAGGFTAVQKMVLLK